MNELDPIIDPAVLEAANQRHDAELRRLHIDPLIKIRPAWNLSHIIRRGKLTDQKINQYEKAGFYSQELKDARKLLAERRRLRREGNFIRSNSGSLIYSPNLWMFIFQSFKCC
jgi:hypothetical protein